MDDEKLKYRIGTNIAGYRKQAGLTQAGLAEKLNYSDKAVSKWERGESMPDVDLTAQQPASHSKQSRRERTRARVREGLGEIFFYRFTSTV